tara:strand:+ start:1211 stop:1630 length:420 start_codon:yes stop_codon:yes gene_type:complete
MNEKENNFYQELKKTRNSKKITLKEISEYTKINTKYLEALENGEFNVLPNVYTRLFLRSYCNYLSIDYKNILDEYEIYTLGHKQQEIIVEQDSSEANNKEISESENLLSEKAKDYKEIIIAIAVIISIVLLFTVINNFN